MKCWEMFYWGDYCVYSEEIRRFIFFNRHISIRYPYRIK